MPKFIDRTGQKFGRLTVISRAGSRNKRTYWKCLCTCGQETIVRASCLVSSHTISCGCVSREAVSQRNKATAKHGCSKTPLYKTWHGIKNRCYNHHAADFPRYGGRGITVCEDWRHSFEAFQEWALAHGYADGLTIDRIDNDGPYSPTNCRWATKSEQGRNKRNNHMVSGKPLVLWAEEARMPYHRLWGRLKAGKSLGLAIMSA